MHRLAVVPGSFDPITLGHLDVIESAAKLFDQLHILVVHNPYKTALLDGIQRITLIEKAIAEREITGKIIVASWNAGLLVEYCMDVGAAFLVKGIRSHSDIEYETPMAIVNRNLAGIETVFLLPHPTHTHVSSSLVRQVSSLGGEVRPYVPVAVAEFLENKQWGDA
jgi:pantetheine-phosphate adenylyltransferase